MVKKWAVENIFGLLLKRNINHFVLFDPYFKSNICLKIIIKKKCSLQT